VIPLVFLKIYAYSLLILSLHFNGYLSRWTWVSQYQNVSIVDFIGAKDDGGGGDNWSYRTCKAPVKSSLSTNQYTTFYRPDALPVSEPKMSKSTEGKLIFSLHLTNQ